MYIRTNAAVLCVSMCLGIFTSGQWWWVASVFIYLLLFVKICVCVHVFSACVCICLCHNVCFCLCTVEVSMRLCSRLTVFLRTALCDRLLPALAAFPGLLGNRCFHDGRDFGAYLETDLSSVSQWLPCQFSGGSLGCWTSISKHYFQTLSVCFRLLGEPGGWSLAYHDQLVFFSHSKRRLTQLCCTLL